MDPILTKFLAAEKTSTIYSENSLFDSVDVNKTDALTDTLNRAYVSNFRHLANLDDTISDVQTENSISDTVDRLSIRYAVQDTDLDWNGFTSWNSVSKKIYRLNDREPASTGN